MMLARRSGPMSATRSSMAVGESVLTAYSAPGGLLSKQIDGFHKDVGQRPCSRHDA